MARQVRGPSAAARQARGTSAAARQTRGPSAGIGGRKMAKNVNFSLSI